MTTSYPTSLDSYATLVDGTDYPKAAYPNNRADALEALEAKLGVDSSAVATSFDYFWKHASGRYRTHVHDGGADDGANVPEANVTFDSSTGHNHDGSNSTGLGERAFQMVVFDFATSVVTGDGKFYAHIDSRLDGMDLVDVHGEVITAGTTNTTDIQIHNLTQTADMLSTKLTIDTGETGSDTAATPAVIDTNNDDVAENDVIRIDVDAISTTAPKGLLITLGFRLP